MDIRPFRGWRFPGKASDVSLNIAPPYDVINAEDRNALLARDPKNIVAIDLPHFPPDQAGPLKGYQHSAWVLGEWKSDGTLRQDEKPALYAYEQEYRWSGKIYNRRAMICGVRATPLGEDVIPHEHTFPGPRADRLELTRHTSAQLSPIFAFYEDSNGEAAETLWSSVRTLPDIWGELNGVTERLWVLDDPGAIATIQASLKLTPAYIADGHHRYTTALAYRDELLAAGSINADHEANFVMFALVPRDDPGLLVLPTHRIISGLRDEFTVERLARSATDFEWQRCSLDDADLSDAGAFLRRYGEGAIAFMDASLAELWIARLVNPAAMQEVASDESDQWRRLDVAVLHKLIIDGALTPWRTDDLSIEYTPDALAVRRACSSGRAQLGVCMQSTPLTVVQDIASSGGSMPHKSTYFYPKLATGMVIKPLE